MTGHRQLVVNPARMLGRRSFLADLGKGTIAFAVVGLSACSGSDSGGAAVPVTTGGSTSGDDTSTSTTEASNSDGGTSGTGDELSWERVSFGFVSAYLLVRDREVAIVDTGTAGGATQIKAGLDAIGASWSDIGHVILTHSHGDHVGGLAEVLENAPGATGYAGAGDLPAIAGLDGFDADALVSVSDGDEVFGLQVIATPGHTPGHIAVFDDSTGLLVAGDSLNGDSGGLVGANSQFSSDMGAADASVKRLAEQSVDTVLVGHGEPVVGGAGVLLTDLANSL